MLVQSAESSSFFAVSCPIAVSVISITAGSGESKKAQNRSTRPYLRRPGNPQADHIASEQLLACCACRDVREQGIAGQIGTF